jgi:hypothetical protein
MTPNDKWREKGLDKTLADSFPSSDPPSTIPDPVSAEPADNPSTGEMNKATDKPKGKSNNRRVNKVDKVFRDTLQSYLDRAESNSIYGG